MRRSSAKSRGRAPAESGAVNEQRPSSGGKPEALVYGLKPVLEALRAGTRPLRDVLLAQGARHNRLQELVSLAREQGIPVKRVPRLEIDRICDAGLHQGIVARISPAAYCDSDELLDLVAAQVSVEPQPLILGLDSIEDPRNLGAILRTAECTGVSGIFVPERRAAPLSPTVAKVAAGALEYVRLARVTNLARLIRQLKERNIWVVGAATQGAIEYTAWDWTLPTALFLGNEGEGLHRLIRERCDALLRIPICGHVESLNVAVAAGVLLYEALRQRSLKQ
jgi:23S rRNA (guanosine2251-2'-O)-methyltransferase